MSSSNATFMMVALFALRCLVPLAITVLIGKWMNHLVSKWEAEEMAQTEVQPAPIPVPAATSTPSPQPISRSQAVACWLLNNCSEQECPAYKQTGVLCWQVRLKAEKALPEKCLGCEIYAQTAPAT